MSAWSHSSSNMTSTSFNVGLNDGTRLSSRVLRPPGGGHTDIFGGEPEPPRGRRAAPPQPPSQIGQGDEPKPTNGTEAAAPAPEAPAPEPPAPAPQNGSEAPAPAPVPQQDSPTKPEPAAAPQPARPEPPKRVRVPPGGFSSGLW